MRLVVFAVVFALAGTTASAQIDLTGSWALYPEYRKALKGYAPPAQCTRYCCGWIEAQGRPEAAPNLACKTDGGPAAPPRTR